MLAKFRSHLTYANVVSSLCLVLVLGGGTAYAVTQIDRNSVFSKHIVNGQVKAPDLGIGAVTSDKLASGAVTPEKVGPGPAVRAQSPSESSNNDQTLNNGDVPEPLLFDEEVYDGGGFHTGGTYDVEQSRFYAPRAGLYEISAGVIFSDPTNGYGTKRQLFLTADPNVNVGGDETYLAGESGPPQNPGATVMNVSTTTRLSVGEAVQAYVSHDAASNLSTPLSQVGLIGDGRHHISLTWLGP